MEKIGTDRLFCVVTICYNAENAIKKTIESVLNQDSINYEYIIEDGSSNDSTVEIAESYSEKFKEKGISYKIISKKDDGIYDAMNKAVSVSEGRYVIFMNSDDCFYSKDVLSNVEKSLNSNYKSGADYPDIIYGDCIVKELNMYFKFRKCFDLIKERMPFSHQACFAKRELLISAPLNTKYKITADYDFLLKAYINGNSFYDCNEIIALTTADGVSSVNMLDTFIEVNKVCDALNVPRFSEKAYNKKLKEMKLKQFVLSYFPDFIKKTIRRSQIKNRGQITNVILPPWA